MLNLNEIRVFLFAAEHSSFSEAARQLNLSQPAVSQRIDNLERYLGIELFKREGRSVYLTEAGRYLQPIAQELISSAFRLEESMAAINGALIGDLQIGCSTISGKNLLPRIAARFRQIYPQVRIHILISSWQLMLDRLTDGELALGLTSRLVEHRDLEYYGIFEDEIILLASPNHPWAGIPYVTPEALIDQPFILREEDSGTSELLARELLNQRISLDMLNIAMVLENAEAIVMAVAEGGGVAFVSRLAAAHALELGRVIKIEVRGMCLSREIYLVRNRRTHTSRSQEVFWDFVRTGEGLFEMGLAGT